MRWFLAIGFWVLAIVTPAWAQATGHVPASDPPECAAYEARWAAMSGATPQAVEVFIASIPAACARLKQRAQPGDVFRREAQQTGGEMERQAEMSRALQREIWARDHRFTLPDFPWPPPTPSERLTLPRGRLLTALPRRPSLFDVGEHLNGALQGARYFEYSYFAVPGGFALVARLERINEDGTPASGGLRFVSPDANEPFSLATYVRQLFVAPQGHYRQIVFVVTDHAFVAAGAPPTSRTAQQWLRRGANTLPDVYRTIRFRHNCQVTALIYEFRKGAGERDIAELNPGLLDAATHLERAGIYPSLFRASPR